MNFYAVIIGTEILNGRRNDKHFAFLQAELQKYGHELFASFIIKDDKELMKRTYRMIKEDSNAIMFSFGGIGSTPDDLTREIASEIFRDSKIVTNKKFKDDIIDRFGDEAYPHRIHMADIPPHATLLKNPINNMSGFSLDDKYFFVPGFPSMAHPMLKEAVNKHFSEVKKSYRYTLMAKTSENTLISIMQQIPTDIELSSLPIFIDNKPNVELSLSGENREEVLNYFRLFEDELNRQNISYKIL